MGNLKNIDTLRDSQKRVSHGLLLIASLAVADEVIVIGDDTFTCVAAAPAAFEFIPGANPAASAVNIAAVINADNTQDLDATLITGQGVFVHRQGAGISRLATTETLTGGGNAWNDATLIGGSEPNLDGDLRQGDTLPISPTASDVTAGQIDRFFPFDPAGAEAFVRDSGGARVAWDGDLVITGNRVTLDNTGAVDWAATSQILLIVVA